MKIEPACAISSDRMDAVEFTNAKKGRKHLPNGIRCPAFAGKREFGGDPRQDRMNRAWQDQETPLCRIRRFTGQSQSRQEPREASSCRTDLMKLMKYLAFMNRILKGSPP
jgi:hypothetical protein